MTSLSDQRVPGGSVGNSVSIGDKVTTASGQTVALVSIGDALANERNAGTSNQYGVGVDECNIKRVTANLTDDAVSSGSPALLFGLIMESGQTGAVTIKDGTTTVITLAPGANGHIDFKGAKFNTNLTVTTAASATCVLLWRPQ